MSKHDAQYLKMAKIWSESSYANKMKVGVIIVKDNTIISDGYNGSISGFPNICENENGKTFPHILHAEANAITKLAKSTSSSEGATLYTSVPPCIECAKLIIQSGIIRVVYLKDHKVEGINLLKAAGIEVNQIKINSNENCNYSEAHSRFLSK